MIDLKELRRLAENIGSGVCTLEQQHNFNLLLRPSNVIGLLDRIEQLEKLCDENHKAYIAAVTR